MIHEIIRRYREYRYRNQNKLQEASRLLNLAHGQLEYLQDRFGELYTTAHVIEQIELFTKDIRNEPA